MPLKAEKSKPIFLKYTFFWSKIKIGAPAPGSFPESAHDLKAADRTMWTSGDRFLHLEICIQRPCMINFK
jgi:hypothetical protein